VAVTVSAPADPVTAAVDRGQLCSVLINLLVNALDAMPTGGRLTVAVETDPAGGPVVRVADTGTGIAAEVLGRLFTPFVTTKPTGSGLGLRHLQARRRGPRRHAGRREPARRRRLLHRPPAAAGGGIGAPEGRPMNRRGLHPAGVAGQAPSARRPPRQGRGAASSGPAPSRGVPDD
jgi:hypothetical protein